MKYINKIILSVLALMAPLAACDTDTLQELNVNPQALNSVNTNFIFTGAQLQIASGGFSGDNRYIDWRTNMGYTMYFMQHFASTGLGLNSAGDKYFDNDEAWNAPWEFWYGGVGKALKLVFDETGEGGFEEGMRPNMVAASKILWALNFHRLTDFYGDIPYSEATQGIDGLFRPKYDTQQSIYMDLFNQLEAGISQISTSNPDEGFADADIMFDGDIAKWKKFGNSIMLRMAMRISNVDQANATKYVTQAMQNGGPMTSNDDNAWVYMADGPSEWTNQNGISRAFSPGDGGQNRVMGKTLIDFLKGTNPNDASDDDPRLMIFSEGIQGDVDPLDQEGQPNGLDQSDLDDYTGVPNTVANETFSSANIKLFDDADPYILLNYAEVELLLAEAAESGIGGVTNAAEHYNNGVKAAMQFWTALEPGDASMEVSDAQVTAYLAAYPYGGGGVTGSESNLEQIGYQMWSAKFLNWWEAWSDWRRTGFPTLVPTNYSGSASPGVIPTKLRIPNREIATNEENYSAGATQPDSPVGKVWWDVD
jgi:hypothetical protein